MPAVGFSARTHCTFAALCSDRLLEIRVVILGARRHGEKAAGFDSFDSFLCSCSGREGLIWCVDRVGADAVLKSGFRLLGLCAMLL